ncbi:MAG: DUF3105 domain-containing protein [Chloroflexi bacterium]|nr:DUF3105 domain-containing protein [Chloroflexota bacterium]
MARRRHGSSIKDIPSKRQQRELRRKQQQNANLLRWGALALVGVAVIAALVWFGTRPVDAMGEEIFIGDASHVPVGTDSGPYQTDPPTGGRHYPATYPAGFYDEEDVENLPKNYEGYLVHNLEHGYIIFWYNCQADPNLSCTELKQAISQVMVEVNNYEVIAFPWPSLKEPLVMTSWGRILRMDKPDLETMREFYRRYHNVAPEPMAE